MKQFFHRLLGVAMLATFALLSLTEISQAGSPPGSMRFRRRQVPAVPVQGVKYIFFFLGDGMSSTQIQAAEAYLTTLNGGSARNPADLLNPANRLNMCKLPVLGMQTTYDDGALMTDSASSATAFACGLKTKSGIIGKNTAKTESYKSVAVLAKESGRKVGILSSVSLNHATPAAYYACVDSRGQMNDIGVQMANSNFDFFGGGSVNRATTPVDVWALLATNGYTRVQTRADILALLTTPQAKVVCTNPLVDGSDAMPYHIDRPASNVSLKEMVEVAVACLSHNSNGFFLAVEGGKIDWAGHANDAMAMIGDVLDLDDAVGVAVDFYNRYPTQTLIVVTGDHETGGMTIGHATTGYTEYYARLLGQTCSYEAFQANQWAAHKATYAVGYDYLQPDNLASNADMLGLMATHFGLLWADLNDYQKEKLEDAYDKSMIGSNDNSNAENTFLYGGYEPIVVTITHIANERASIGWTSYSHTGVPVPVFAIGAGAEAFAGFYDNTDLAKKIASAMHVAAPLPIKK